MTSGLKVIYGSRDHHINSEGNMNKNCQYNLCGVAWKAEDERGHLLYVWVCPYLFLNKIWELFKY